MKASVQEVNQNNLLKRAQSAYVPYAEMVQIAKKMDREHMSILYGKIWYKNNDGLKAIVESGNYSYDTIESLMLRTDVHKDVSKKVIEHYVYDGCEKVIMHRYFDETNTELLKLLERCFQVNGVKFPLDKSSAIVQTCLDKYVDRFITNNPLMVIKSLQSIHLKLSTYYSDYMRNRERVVSDSEKLEFKRIYGDVVKQYALKEISYSDLGKKLNRVFY